MPGQDLASAAAGAPPALRSAVVVGAGGNIGSHLVSHLARMPHIGRVTLIDRDVYEAKNVTSQDVTPGDVGRPKALVQARKLRRINPALSTQAIVNDVENVPLGVLHADVVFGCLDSRGARRYLAEALWRLGVTYIDAGVHPDGWLARVTVYVPGTDAACVQCPWDADEYAAQEQAYPCLESRPATPTNGPSSLGAVAGALQAVEAGKLLTGHAERALAGQQFVLDLWWDRQQVSALRRNPQCRFDHHTLDIQRLPLAPQDLSLGDVLALNSAAGGRGAALEVPGMTFVRRRTCSGCGTVREGVRLAQRLRPADRTCRRCGAPMVAAGFDYADRLGAADLSAAAQRRSLTSLGIEAGELLTVVSSGGAAHYLLDPM